MTGLKRFATSGLLGLLGLFALAFSAHAQDHPDYVLGLALFVGCVLMILTMIGQHFSGQPDGWVPDAWPVRTRNQWILILVLAALGIAGLFVAAAHRDVLYYVGLGLFAGCCVLAFRVLGSVFDAQRPRRRRRR